MFEACRLNLKIFAQVRAEEISKLNDLLRLSFKATKLDNKVTEKSAINYIPPQCSDINTLHIFSGHFQQIGSLPRVQAADARRNVASCAQNGGSLKHRKRK